MSDNTSPLNDVSDVNGIDLSPILPAGGNVVQCAQAHVHINLALGREDNGRRNGGACVVMGYQLLVTGSAYAIEIEEIVNGPE